MTDGCDRVFMSEVLGYVWFRCGIGIGVIGGRKMGMGLDVKHIHRHKDAARTKDFEMTAKMIIQRVVRGLEMVDAKRRNASTSVGSRTGFR